MLMKKSFNFFVPIIFVILLFSCQANDGQPETVQRNIQPPVLALDSLFALPDQDQIKQKAADVDAVFQRLRKITGFNGTVLYAEQGRVIYKNALDIEMYVVVAIHCRLTINLNWHLCQKCLRQWRS